MIEALQQLVNEDTALVRRGRYLTTTFLLQIGQAAWLIAINEGRVASVTKDSFVMASSAFALRVEAEAWRKFCQHAHRRGRMT